MIIKKRLPRIGIVGTGFIATGLSHLLYNSKNFHLSGMLTRRKGLLKNLPVNESCVFNDPERLFETSDLLVVATGDPVYNTDVILKAFDYGLPVVTMDAETQVISGSWLSKRGFLTEAEGDQPGSIAALDKEIRDMGFQPLVYGNIKGFLNHNPSIEDMLYWSKVNGISLSQVTSFTDGTKVQIEQCLVANGLGSDIYKQGLLKIQSSDINIGAMALAEKAEQFGAPISDFILDKTAPPGVFIVAKHDNAQLPYLKYLKMGSKGKFVLTKPFHLCHIEIPKTIKNVLNFHEILLNNGSIPTISVGSISKREIKKGESIVKGIGSFDCRGEALRIVDVPEHVPIGLLADAQVKRTIEPGQIIHFDDVEIPESTALMAWLETRQEVTNKEYYGHQASAISR
ncbi:MAG: NAD(P)-dependent oxidoreductase [Bacteroidota bacterium]|nr:NAD(P)-dependent oxidoreductase [Bacteroidota bacterium]